jgi:pimeloyl-ACP methyl ester carboxylesterase
MSNTSVVLVHGAFADGSGWQAVYEILKRDGFEVLVVQNPLTSFAADVAAAKSAIAAAKGDVILVGHSYGGVVISEAGNDPKVKALAYIAAFAPDKGESVASLFANPPPGAVAPPILPPVNGFLFVDKEKFPQAFAADVKPELAAFMADSQVPWSTDSFSGAVTNPAWRSKPSWYLLTSEDHMIPPPAQRGMAERAGAKVTEVSASHAVYVSKPQIVADLIKAAAKG